MFGSALVVRVYTAVRDVIFCGTCGTKKSHAHAHAHTHVRAYQFCCLRGCTQASEKRKCTCPPETESEGSGSGAFQTNYSMCHTAEYTIFARKKQTNCHFLVGWHTFLLFFVDRCAGIPGGLVGGPRAYIKITISWVQASPSA